MKLYPYLPSIENANKVLDFVKQLDEPYLSDDWQLQRLGLLNLDPSLMVARDKEDNIRGYISFTAISNGVFAVEASGMLHGVGLRPYAKRLFNQACQYAFSSLDAHKIVATVPKDKRKTKKFLILCGFIKFGFSAHFLKRGNNDTIGVVLLSKDRLL